MRKLLISIVILVFLTSAALADKMNDALDAANFGDYEKAYQLWLVEAGKGNAAAQANLGLMHEDGLGVPPSDKEAVKWYRMAAGQGEPRALYYMGTAFEEGRGVPQDYKEAANNYRLAATQGYVKAQYKLGLLYLKGLGVERSTEDAYAWWSVAASKGHEDAKKYKDSALQQMTARQIEVAQEKAKQIWAEVGN